MRLPFIGLMLGCVPCLTHFVAHDEYGFSRLLSFFRLHIWPLILPFCFATPHFVTLISILEFDSNCITLYVHCCCYIYFTTMFGPEMLMYNTFSSISMNFDQKKKKKKKRRRKIHAYAVRTFYKI